MLNTRRSFLSLVSTLPSSHPFPFSPILRSVHVCRASSLPLPPPPLSLSLSLSLSLNRVIPTPAMAKPAARERSRKINSPPPSLSPSAPPRVKRLDGGDRRSPKRLHLHCRYERAHDTRGMPFLLLASVLDALGRATRYARPDLRCRRSLSRLRTYADVHMPISIV